MLTVSRCKLHAFFFLLFLSPFIVKAQTATINGSVLDSAGKKVELAFISYIGSTTSVKPDNNGRYSLTIPAGQAITLIVNAPGFIEQRIPVNVNEGETITINVNLRAKNQKTFVFTDTLRKRESIPTPIFDHLPGPPDISKILRYAGAVSNNEFSNQYSVRGGSFDENVIYVNGVEVFRPLLTRAGQQEGLSFVNLDMVSGVDFYTGGYGAKYGDKMASVLDVRYRQPSKFQGTASASLLGITAEVEGITKNLAGGWMIGIRQKSNRYLLRSLDTKGDYAARFIDIQGQFTYNLTDKMLFTYIGNYAVNKYTLTPSSRETDFGTINNALRFTVYFDGQEINQFKTMFHAATIDYQYRNWGLKFIVSSFNTYETESFDVQGQYYIDQLEADFGKPTFGQVSFNRGVGTFLNHARNYLDVWVNNAEVKGVRARGNTVWNVGLRYQNERINDEISEWNMVDSAGYSIPYLPTNSIDLQDVVKTRAQLYSNRVMGYVQYNYFNTLKDSSEISFSIGVRSHYWDLNKQTIVSPRSELKYSPYWLRDSGQRIQITFRAALGIYDQPAFYRDLRDFNGKINPDIKAQHAVHAIIGSDLLFEAWGRPFRFIAEAYFKYFDRLIPFEVNDVRLRYFGKNLSYGRTYGLDLRVNGEFVKGVESWVNLSLLRTEENLYNDDYYLYLNSDGDTIISGFTFNDTIRDSLVQVPGWIPRPTDQLLTFSLYFQDHLPGFEAFKMNLGLILGTGFPFGPPNHKRYQQIFRMPPYRRVDIGFSYEFFSENRPLKRANHPLHNLKSLWLGLEVFNLLQVQNTISYYWVKDVTGRSYAIPNYLTNRQLSLRMIVRF
jgi:Carboxypeptidase regulatory-like domain/TonB-dependent Receptor Plug Domain